MPYIISMIVLRIIYIKVYNSEKFSTQGVVKIMYKHNNTNTPVK